MRKVFLSLSLVMLLGLLLTACGKKETTGTESTTTTPTSEVTATNSPTPTETPTPTEPPRNLGGMEVLIGDTWSGDDWDSVGSDAYSIAFYDMLHEAEKTYNFKLNRKAVGSWGPSFAEAIQLAAEDNNPAASVYLLDSRYLFSLVTESAILDLAGITTVDWNDEKWNSAVRELMTFGGKVYGFSTGRDAGTGLFFNKAILEEAGIDPNLLYELEKSNKWNWEEFEKICAQVSANTNHCAMTEPSVEFFFGTLLSNDTFLITKDASGLFKTNLDAPEVLAAVDFIRSLNTNGYMMKKPNGASWDWDKAAFINGEVVFRLGNPSGTYEIRDLDYGFVCFPYGPSAGHPVTFNVSGSTNIYVLANCDKIKESAEDILFAMDIYTNPPEGTEFNALSRQLGNYEYYMKDESSLDVSIRMMLTDCEEIPNLSVLFPDLSNAWYGVDLMKGSSAQEALAPFAEPLAKVVEETNAALTGAK